MNATLQEDPPAAARRRAAGRRSRFVQQSLNRDRDRLGLTRVAAAGERAAGAGVHHGGAGRLSRADLQRALDARQRSAGRGQVLRDGPAGRLDHQARAAFRPGLARAGLEHGLQHLRQVQGSSRTDRWRWVQGAASSCCATTACATTRTRRSSTASWRGSSSTRWAQNLDDANMYYKQRVGQRNGRGLRQEEAQPGRTDPSPDRRTQKERAQLLRETYKMDPQFMKEVDERYGPLEWRLPEAHAIYWAALGLKKAAENPTKIKADDLITLRRVIYQSMQLSFHRGPAGRESLCQGVRVRAQPRHHSQGQRRLRAGSQGRREQPRSHLEGAPEFPARRRLLPLRVQSPGRCGALV